MDEPARRTRSSSPPTTRSRTSAPATRPTRAAPRTITVAQGSAAVTVSNAGVTKVVVSTDQGHTSGSSVAVGEILTYTVTVTVPEAVSNNVTLVDTLDPGLAFVGFDSLVVSNPAAVTTNAAGGFPGVLSGAAVSNPGGTAETAGSRVTFNFGNVTNTNTDSGVPETITLTYRAVVLNTTANVRGQARNNSAVWTAGGRPGGGLRAERHDRRTDAVRRQADRACQPGCGRHGHGDAGGVARGRQQRRRLQRRAARRVARRIRVTRAACRTPQARAQPRCRESGGVIDATWTTFPPGGLDQHDPLQRDRGDHGHAGTGRQQHGVHRRTRACPARRARSRRYNTLAYERTGNTVGPRRVSQRLRGLGPCDGHAVHQLDCGLRLRRSQRRRRLPAGGGEPEPPIAGVTITLTGTDHLGNPVSLTTTTLGERLVPVREPAPRDLHRHRDAAGRLRRRAGHGGHAVRRHRGQRRDLGGHDPDRRQRLGHVVQLRRARDGRRVDRRRPTRPIL